MSGRQRRANATIAAAIAIVAVVAGCSDPASVASRPTSSRAVTAPSQSSTASGPIGATAAPSESVATAGSDPLGHDAEIIDAFRFAYADDARFGDAWMSLPVSEHYEPSLRILDGFPSDAVSALERDLFAPVTIYQGGFAYAQTQLYIAALTTAAPTAVYSIDHTVGTVDVYRPHPALPADLTASPVIRLLELEPPIELQAT